MNKLNIWVKIEDDFIYDMFDSDGSEIDLEDFCKQLLELKEKHAKRGFIKFGIAVDVEFERIDYSLKGLRPETDAECNSRIAKEKKVKAAIEKKDRNVFEKAKEYYINHKNRYEESEKTKKECEARPECKDCGNTTCIYTEKLKRNLNGIT